MRRLDPEDLLIPDGGGSGRASRVLGMAGVMGGASSEVTPSTTDVLIEAASFDPATISHTLRRHNLPSEASKRFHRGVDPNAAYSAAHLAARLLVELASGTLSVTETVAGELPTMPLQTIDAGLPTAILGVEVPVDRVVEILRESGCDVEVDGARLTLVPPTWRPDLRDPYDYVEEVGRKVGFDTIPSIVPAAPVGRGLSCMIRRACARPVPT